MGYPLCVSDYRLLRALNEDGGFTTREACCRAGLSVGRRDTALRRMDMLHLKKLGLVIELDHAKPVAWVRTSEGTVAMAEGYGPSSPVGRTGR